MASPRVDYDLFGPPVTMGPGLDAIGEAILQVQRRKEAKAAAEAKARAEYEQWSAEQAWKQQTHADDMAVKGADLGLRQQTEARHQTEGNRLHERDSRRIQVDAYGRAVPHLREGDAALAQPFLDAAGPAAGARPTPPQPAPARRGPVLDPLWEAMEQRRAAQPEAGGAPPPARAPLDPLDAVMQDRARKAKEVGGAMGGVSRDPVAAQAAKEVEAMVAAGMPREKAIEKYRAIVDAEKNREIARARANRPGGGGMKLPEERYRDQLGIFGVGGKQIGSTGDPKRDGEIRKKNAAFVQFDTLVAKLEDSYANDGRVLPGTEAAERRQSIYEQMRIAIKNNEELGALVGADWALIEGQIGKGGGLYLVDPTPRLRETRSAVRTRHAQILDSYGVNGADMVPKLLGGPQEKPQDAKPSQSLADRIEAIKARRKGGRP